MYESYQMVLIQSVLVFQLALMLSSYTPVGRDLDSTSHHPHMLHCDMMEQVLVADTGRIYLSSLQYCCMPPQSLHWLEWEELHSQQYWLDNKKKNLVTSWTIRMHGLTNEMTHT